MRIPYELEVILNHLHNNGAKPLLVGGCVRDHLLGIIPKDFDVEVFGLPMDKLIQLLSEHGKVDAVGKSFGVLKLNNLYDFSLPRRDNKIGVGHKDFNVIVDENMSIEEACSRRDFTINSVAYDYIEQKLIDPFNGKKDIEEKWLDPTSDAFFEDPLRVLRGFQFAGRFNMDASFTTIMFSKQLVSAYNTIPIERIWIEWQKWAAKSIVPQKGINFLDDVHWLQLYTQISNLLDLPQDPYWHPEGSVLIHTKYVCDSMAEICSRESIEDEDRVVLMFAALCHDMGKINTTTINKVGRIISPRHDQTGVPIARKFLEEIGCFPRIIEKVLPLVREHMVHLQSHSAKSARKLAVRLEPANIQMLMHLIEADHSGRPPLPKGLPDKAKSLYELATNVHVVNGKPKPLLQGRHFLDMGFAPGPEIGVKVRIAYQAQLNGAFITLDEGLKWLDNG